jgi:uncharacterized protein
VAKFLLVIAVFIVVYLLVRNVANKGAAAREPASNGGASKNGASKLEDMVRCGICGVHLPTSEAITSRGDFFCSKEHLQLAVRQRDSR